MSASATHHTRAPDPSEKIAWNTATPPNDSETATATAAATATATSQFSKEEDLEATKEYVETKDKKDPNIVDWDGDDDQENPRNWAFGYKSWITVQLGFLALSASLGSSIISPAGNAVAEYVGVSAEVSVLSISLYILGFAFGPLLWAPASELWGRRVSILPAVFCLGLFSIGTAAIGLHYSLLRGVFGSAPVSNVSAALGDIWHPKARGTAVCFYAVAVVGGPTLGPLIGSAILVNPHLGWRWTEYIEAIWVFATLAVCIFCLPEMYAPVLLKKKAQRLRKETGNAALYHPHERIKLSPKTIFTKHLSRPLILLTTEPMVTCIAIYASF
ncbi:putative MFS-type transporter, partial [Lachnellula willkommii]